MPETTSIQEICNQYNMTQAEMAKLLGIPLRTFEKWCTGERKPTDYLVNMIKQLVPLKFGAVDRVDAMVSTLIEDVSRQELSEEEICARLGSIRDALAGISE